MKAYTFVNSYICGIQVGIQAGHSLVELVKNADCDDEIRRWADDHKTFVWLDGGSSADLDEIYETAMYSSMPSSYFQEEGLGDMTTAVTVILNEDQVDVIDKVRKCRHEMFIEHSDVDSTCWFQTITGDVSTTPMDRKDMYLLKHIVGARTKSL